MWKKDTGTYIVATICLGHRDCRPSHYLGVLFTSAKKGARKTKYTRSSLPIAIFTILSHVPMICFYDVLVYDGVRRSEDTVCLQPELAKPVGNDLSAALRCSQGENRLIDK